VVGQLCPQVPENLIHRLFVALPAEAVVGAAAGAAVIVIKFLSQHHAAGQHPQLQVSNFQPGYLKEGEGNTLTVYQTLQCPIKKNYYFVILILKTNQGNYFSKCYSNIVVVLKEIRDLIQNWTNFTPATDTKVKGTSLWITRHQNCVLHIHKSSFLDKCGSSLFHKLLLLYADKPTADCLTLF